MQRAAAMTSESQPHNDDDDDDDDDDDEWVDVRGNSEQLVDELTQSKQNVAADTNYKHQTTAVGVNTTTTTTTSQTTTSEQTESNGGSVVNHNEPQSLIHQATSSVDGRALSPNTMSAAVMARFFSLGMTSRAPTDNTGRRRAGSTVHRGTTGRGAAVRENTRRSPFAADRSRVQTPYSSPCSRRNLADARLTGIYSTVTTSGYNCTGTAADSPDSSRVADVTSPVARMTTDVRTVYSAERMAHGSQSTVATSSGDVDGTESDDSQLPVIVSVYSLPHGNLFSPEIRPSEPTSQNECQPFHPQQRVKPPTGTPAKPTSCTAASRRVMSAPRPVDFYQYTSSDLYKYLMSLMTMQRRQMCHQTVTSTPAGLPCSHDDLLVNQLAVISTLAPRMRSVSLSAGCQTDQCPRDTTPTPIPTMTSSPLYAPLPCCSARETADINRMSTAVRVTVGHVPTGAGDSLRHAGGKDLPQQRQRRCTVSSGASNKSSQTLSGKNTGVPAATDLLHSTAQTVRSKRTSSNKQTKVQRHQKLHKRVEMGTIQVNSTTPSSDVLQQSSKHNVTTAVQESADQHQSGTANNSLVYRPTARHFDPIVNTDLPALRQLGAQQLQDTESAVSRCHETIYIEIIDSSDDDDEVRNSVDGLTVRTHHGDNTTTVPSVSRVVSLNQHDLGESQARSTSTASFHNIEQPRLHSPVLQSSTNVQNECALKTQNARLVTSGRQPESAGHSLADTTLSPGHDRSMQSAVAENNRNRLTIPLRRLPAITHRNTAGLSALQQRTAGISGIPANSDAFHRVLMSIHADVLLVNDQQEAATCRYECLPDTGGTLEQRHTAGRADSEKLLDLRVSRTVPAAAIELSTAGLSTRSYDVLDPRNVS